MEILTKNYLTRGFWGDEAWTALISQLSLKEIITTTAQDFHPPFYYFLVHFWIRLFGDSETAIRFLSVVFWILTSLVLYKLCLYLWEKRRALLATIFALTNPFIFTYAFEARSYGLLTLLTAASMFCFLKTLKNLHPWGILLVLANAAGVYTHYYMWFVILAQGIYLLVFEKSSLKKFIPLFSGVFIAYLPWLPVLLQQSKDVAQEYWIPKMDKRTHLDTFFRLIAGPETGTVTNLLVSSYALIFLISILVWLKRPKQPSKTVVFLLLWLFIPIAVPSLISLYKPVYFYRYLVFASIPLALLAFFSLPGKRYSLVFLIFLNLILDCQVFTRHPPSMGEALAKIYRKPYSSEVIFTFLPSFAEVAYYNRDRLRIIVSKQGLVQFSGKSLLDTLVEQGRAEIGPPPSGRFWQVEPGSKVTLKQAHP